MALKDVIFYLSFLNDHKLPLGMFDPNFLNFTKTNSCIASLGRGRCASKTDNTVVESS